MTKLPKIPRTVVVLDTGSSAQLLSCAKQKCFYPLSLDSGFRRDDDKRV